ncbi:MAG TPA: hypothetical protein VIG42_10080 [Solirubrobacteraceae bacterium]|jgi:hypothetical protein
MEPSASSRPPASEPVTADAARTKAYGNRHFKPTKVPGLLKSRILPAWLGKLFRRTQTPGAR